MELSVEKSKELAEQIEIIKLHLFLIDLDYAKEVSKAMFNQADRQDSLSVLNPSYNPDKSELLKLHSMMLDCLIKFVELGKKSDELKKHIALVDSAIEKINAMFM